MLLCGGHHLAVSSFYNGRRPLCLLFCDQKSSRKVPLLPRRGARLRGCSPLGRGSLPRNSETFFVSFFGHKKGKPCGQMPFYRGVRRKVAEHRKPQLKINKQKETPRRSRQGAPNKEKLGGNWLSYLPRCQMSASYSAMVRSLLNMPALAMLIRHLRRQPSGSQA